MTTAPACARSTGWLVTAVRLIGRTGAATRFLTADAFATYAGAAPIRSLRESAHGSGFRAPEIGN